MYATSVSFGVMMQPTWDSSESNLASPEVSSEAPSCHCEDRYERAPSPVQQKMPIQGAPRWTLPAPQPVYSTPVVERPDLDAGTSTITVVTSGIMDQLVEAIFAFFGYK